MADSEILRSELAETVADIHRNLSHLWTCDRHLFESRAAIITGRRYPCMRCCGQMSLADIWTYIDGYKAAGGNPNDIWPSLK